MNFCRKITYAGAVYDRTYRLQTGEVRPVGIDLTYLPCHLEDLFWRQGKYAEFDAAEYSFGAYVASLEDPDYPFVALPVFLSKAFRHSAVYVRADSDFHLPGDLRSRRIGTPEWSQTGSLWIRGIMGEHYGLDLSSVTWRVGGLQQSGRQEKSRVRPPARFEVNPLSEGQTLQQALLDGEIDAVITARPPAAFTHGDKRIRRLFQDYRQEERDYYQASGIFPIMHVLILRKAILTSDPWVANNLRAAFEEARRPAQSELLDNAVSKSSLIWESRYAEEERHLFGDPFCYGLDENRVTLTAFCRYAYEQGFTTRQLAPEDLFFPPTLTSARI